MNIAPPRLKARLLLAGMTIWELAIMAVLALAGFFFGDEINALFWPMMWLIFCMRLYQGKSLRSLLTVLLRYHTTPQQFTRRSEQK